MLVHRWTGEGRKLTQTGVCNLLGWITERCTMYWTNWSELVKTPVWTSDWSLQLYYWAIILIWLSMPQFAGFNFNTAGLMMGHSSRQLEQILLHCATFERSLTENTSNLLKFLNVVSHTNHVNLNHYQLQNFWSWKHGYMALLLWFMIQNLYSIIQNTAALATFSSPSKTGS